MRAAVEAPSSGSSDLLATAAPAERTPLSRRHTVGVGYTHGPARYPHPSEIPVTHSTDALRFRPSRGLSPDSRRQAQSEDSQEKYAKRAKVVKQVWTVSKWMYAVLSLLALIMLVFALKATNKMAMNMQDKWHRTYDAYALQHDALKRVGEEMEDLHEQRLSCKDQLSVLTKVTQGKVTELTQAKEDYKHLQLQLQDVTVAFRQQNQELVEARKQLALLSNGSLPREALKVDGAIEEESVHSQQSVTATPNNHSHQPLRPEGPDSSAPEQSG